MIDSRGPRERTLLRAAPLAVIAAVLLLVVSAVVLVASRDDADNPRCRSVASRVRTPTLTGRCGVIWGAATDPNTLDRLKSVERVLGRRFDMTYRFHELDAPVPTPDERAVVASGRILHVSIDARLGASPQRTVTWTEVAAGAFDAMLRAQANGIATLNAPVFVTFDHEPDQPDHASVRGTPSDFIAAWRHVHDLFRAAKVSNAVWVWVVTGETETADLAGRMWPGNRYVDWISWEAYSPSGCRVGTPDPARSRSFADSALPFFDWLQEHGTAAGFDLRKPMMLSEVGATQLPTSPLTRASWYGQIPDVLAAHPQIRAVGLWDRPGKAQCRYGFDDSSIVRRAVSAAGLRPPMRQP